MFPTVILLFFLPVEWVGRIALLLNSTQNDYNL